MNGLNDLIGYSIKFENTEEFIKMQKLLFSYKVYWPDCRRKVYLESPVANCDTVRIELSNGRVQFGLTSLATVEKTISYNELEKILKPSIKNRPKFNKRVIWY